MELKIKIGKGRGKRKSPLVLCIWEGVRQCGERGGRKKILLLKWRYFYCRCIKTTWFWCYKNKKLVEPFGLKGTDQFVGQTVGSPGPILIQPTSDPIIKLDWNRDLPAIGLANLVRFLKPWLIPLIFLWGFG